MSISPSLYEIPLMIAHAKTGIAASVLLVLLLVLNVAVQILFAVIVYEALVEVKDEEFVEELLSWRRSTAHDAAYYDKITRKSLVSRVCANDDSLVFANGQRDLYRELSLYLGPEGTGRITQGARGPIMCVLSLLAFLLTISRELNATIQSPARGT